MRITRRRAASASRAEESSSTCTNIAGASSSQGRAAGGSGTCTNNAGASCTQGSIRIPVLCLPRVDSKSSLSSGYSERAASEGGLTSSERRKRQTKQERTDARDTIRAERRGISGLKAEMDGTGYDSNTTTIQMDLTPKTERPIEISESEREGEDTELPSIPAKRGRGRPTTNGE